MKATRLINRKTNSAHRELKANNNKTSATNSTSSSASPSVAPTSPAPKAPPVKTSSSQLAKNSSRPKSGGSVPGEQQICNICAQNVPGPERERIFAFGKCDHHVCYVCSTRLRVICDQSECPICREKLEHVLFSTNKAQSFDKHNLKDYIYNEKFKIYFESDTVKGSFDDLLKFECQECCKQKPASHTPSKQQVNRNIGTIRNSRNNKKIEDDAQGLLENSFSQVNETKFEDVFGLKNHLNYVHQLQLCDLCLTHNKLFPFEYSYYDEVALKKHIEKGEPKTSHRGHPNCALCHQTFFNAEELISHMSREHYHCHLCGRHESNMRVYFLDYRTLREHFRSKHILCEKDNCKHEQFTSVFDNEIDYKMHLMSLHQTQTAGMSRSETRQQRTITLEQPAYRSRREVSDRNLPPNTAIVSTGPVATANNLRNQRPPESLTAQLRQQRMPTRAEFPALGQSSVNASSQAVTISNTDPFPSLPTASASTTGPATVRPATVSTSMRHRVTAGPSNSGARSSFVRTMGGGSRPPERLDEMDFPPLPEQPKAKVAKKAKNRSKKGNWELSVEELIQTKLNLTNKTNKTNSKKSTTKGPSAKAAKKAIKILL